MYFENDIQLLNTTTYDKEYLPSIFDGKIDKEMLI